VKDGWDISNETFIKNAFKEYVTIINEFKDDIDNVLDKNIT
jgi:hypothetical protein